MKTTAGRRARVLPVLAACFLAGGIVGWWLRDQGPPHPVAEGIARVVASPAASGSSRPPAAAAARPADRPMSTTGEPTMSAAVAPEGMVLEELQRRALRVPIDGADVERMKGSFEEHRSGAGGHEHDAVDILAPRDTPIHAVEDGTIAKLFFSKAGGVTIYQFDPTRQFCYYYAHLERYASGVRDGQRVARGDVIGYVGTSGNAPPGTPHLHFGVYQLTPEHRWWQGRAINPYLVFHH